MLCASWEPNSNYSQRILFREFHSKKSKLTLRRKKKNKRKREREKGVCLTSNFNRALFVELLSGSASRWVVPTLGARYSLTELELGTMSVLSSIPESPLFIFSCWRIHNSSKRWLWGVLVFSAVFNSWPPGESKYCCIPCFWNASLPRSLKSITGESLSKPKSSGNGWTVPVFFLGLVS